MPRPNPCRRYPALPGREAISGEDGQKPGEPIGEVAARGDAEIGFHQVIELIPLKGIQYLGRCPLRCKKITVFLGGIHSGKAAAEATAALVQFLTSPAAKPTIKRHGLEPG